LIHVKLTTRISLYFLVALALVLVGMSASMYLLVYTHQMHRLDEQLGSALHELIAAVEFGSDGLEWESGDRQFVFSHATADVPLAWNIVDLADQQLDGSRKTSFPSMKNQPPATDDQIVFDTQWNADTWRVARRIIRSTSHNAADGPIHNEPDVKRYPALIISVAVPVSPSMAPLRMLAGALLAVSLGIWCVAAIGGHWLAAKSVAPLASMARSARAISAADFNERLTPVDTRDELGDLNRAFNDLLTRLQESFQRQKRFAAEASHQLRTPLTAMLGQIDVALRRGRDADEYRQALQAAQSQGMRLHQIVESLLFLTREDRDAVTPALETIEIHGWLADHLQSWRQHPRYADLNYVANANGSGWVKAQPLLLGEAVDNLLHNACKYSKLYSTITVKIETTSNTVGIVVQDCGLGIAPADLPHLFEPFFRSAAAREQGISGVGLGLAVGRRIVTIFRGQIEVESTLGEGSRFVIKLPLCKQPLPTERPLLEPSDV
jgi:signal transduction histidine kinase